MCGNTTALQSDLAEFGAVIDQVYQSALDATAWPRTAAMMARYLGAKSALLYTPLEPRDSPRFCMFSPGLSARLLELWFGKYRPFDVWTQVGIERGLLVEGNTARGTDLVPTEDLKQTPWYREFLSMEDIPQVMIGIVFDGQTPGTPPTSFSVFRGEQQPPFAADDLARLAVTLSEGDELAEAAQRHGISLNTAKSQLQAIYAKTGTDNRARLTKLLLALASGTVTGG